MELQARVQINLAAFTEQRVGIDVASALCREITVNLFDAPQREAHRLQVVSMRAAKMTEKQIAAELDLTITATQRTAAPQRRINELELTDPYVPVLSEADLELSIPTPRRQGFGIVNDDSRSISNASGLAARRRFFVQRR